VIEVLGLQLGLVEEALPGVGAGAHGGVEHLDGVVGSSTTCCAR